MDAQEGLRYEGIADLSGVDPFSRMQPGLKMRDVFPTIPGKVCACGCGRALEGRRTRWATDGCGSAAYSWFSVIAGFGIRTQAWGRDRGICAECAIKCGDRWSPRWEAHHVVPVHLGGGGCTLDGIQTLCTGCHLRKTSRDAKRRAERRRSDSTQTEML